MLVNDRQTDSGYVQDRAELRQHVGRTLEAQADMIVAEAVTVFPFAGFEGDPGDGAELARDILQVLLTATREGTLDMRLAPVAELRRLATEKGVSIRLFFTLIYLIER